MPPPRSSNGKRNSTLKFAPVDSATLTKQLSEMDLSDGTKDLSMDDILKKMSDTKRRAAALKEPKSSPSARPLTAPFQPDSPATDFRETTWNKSCALSDNLKKTIHRPPFRDPSGEIIRSLGRAKYTGDGPVWFPVNVDQVIPIPGVETFTNNYRKGIVKHLSTVIDKEDSRYRVLPTVTDQMRIHKADVYADLFNLRQVRERLSRTHTAGSMHSVDGSTAPPHSLPHDTISPFTRPASIRGHQVCTRKSFSVSGRSTNNTTQDGRPFSPASYSPNRPFTPDLTLESTLGKPGSPKSPMSPAVERPYVVSWGGTMI